LAQKLVIFQFLPLVYSRGHFKEIGKTSIEAKVGKDREYPSADVIESAFRQITTE